MKLQQKINVQKMFRLLVMVAVIALQIVIVDRFALTANAQGTAVVSADSGKIREKASTGSEAIASVQNGDKLDVIAQTTDSEGYTWYKIYVNGTQTGYIRADLVKDVEGTIPTESGESQETKPEQKPETKPEDKEEDKKEETKPQTVTTVVTVSPSNVVEAKVTGSKVNVRETPSTNGNVKGSAKGDTIVTVSGEATDSTGAIWYQISFNSGDSTINGFIRSDYLEVTQTLEGEVTPEEPTEGEEPAEEEVVPEPTPSVPQDYEVHYEANAEGVEEWFLYDHQKGTKQSISNLFTVLNQTQEAEAKLKGQVKTYKIVMIIMAVAILGLVVGVTVLLFKIRDLYEDYEDYYGDEEGDGDGDYENQSYEDEAAAYERGEEVEDITAEIAGVNTQYQPTGNTGKMTQPQVDQATQAGDWQPKNFLDIDDDMEFDFLDIR